MLQYLVFVGVVIQFLGILGYIRDTLRGTTKPNRVTWFLWFVAPLIGTIAAISDGVSLAVLPIFMASFGPLLVLGASFINKEAYWKLSWFDYFCGALSVLALILWIITDEPPVAIIFAIIADGFAALPTLLKAWRYPDTESAIEYAATIIGVSLGFFAIESWRVSEYAFSTYILVINAIILFAIYFRRKVK